MTLAPRIALALVTSVCAFVITGSAADSRLADAAQKDSIAQVRALLAQHADVNTPQVDGMTALIWAAHNDNVALAKLLIAAGASAKSANRYGVTALSEAASNGSPGMLELLLKAGADPNTAMPEGDTVLMLASRAGNAPAVKVLLEHGAKPNIKEEWHGETALMWAAGENHPDVVKVLIEHGADPNLQATHLVYPEMKKAPAQVLSSYPPGGLTALMEAARQDAIEAAQALIQGGANVNQKDPSDLTALIIAIANAHWDMANLLIEAGSNLNDGALPEAVEVRNAIVLRAASNRTDERNVLDIIKVLLAHGAKPDSVLTSKLPAKKALGGAPSAPTDAPALYRAAKATDLEVMRLLLEKGASPSHALKDGTTALMVASGLGRGGPGGLDHERVITEDDMITAAKLCLYYGADINAVDGTGQTALHGAAQKGADKVVQFLADRGAKLDMKDKRERTALEVAMGVKGRGPAGGFGPPPQVHESTAALLKKLMGLPPDWKPAEPPATEAKADQSKDENKAE